ncbi:MAG TPA: hypothetical protein VHM89_01130 [Acidimicrobiales bacterium]|nr:hypothetical protein [Acidimicrobiales bacterium]
MLPDRQLEPDTAAGYYESLSRGQIVSTFAEILRFPRFTTAAADRVGVSDGDRPIHVDVVVVPETTIIKVTATARRSRVVTDLADAVLAEATAYFHEVSSPYSVAIVSRAARPERTGPSTSSVLAALAVVSVVVAVLVQQAVYQLSVLVTTAGRRQRPAMRLSPDDAGLPDRRLGPPHPAARPAENGDGTVHPMVTSPSNPPSPAVTREPLASVPDSPWWLGGTAAAPMAEPAHLEDGPPPVDWRDFEVPVAARPEPRVASVLGPEDDARPDDRIVHEGAADREREDLPVEADRPTWDRPADGSESVDVEEPTAVEPDPPVDDAAVPTTVHTAAERPAVAAATERPDDEVGADRPDDELGAERRDDEVAADQRPDELPEAAPAAVEPPDDDLNADSGPEARPLVAEGHDAVLSPEPDPEFEGAAPAGTGPADVQGADDRPDAEAEGADRPDPDVQAADDPPDAEVQGADDPTGPDVQAADDRPDVEAEGVDDRPDPDDGPIADHSVEVFGAEPDGLFGDAADDVDPAVDEVLVARGRRYESPTAAVEAAENVDEAATPPAAEDPRDHLPADSDPGPDEPVATVDRPGEMSAEPDRRIDDGARAVDDAPAGEAPAGDASAAVDLPADEGNGEPSPSFDAVAAVFDRLRDQVLAQPRPGPEDDVATSEPAETAEVVAEAVASHIAADLDDDAEAGAAVPGLEPRSDDGRAEPDARGEDPDPTEVRAANVEDQDDSPQPDASAGGAAPAVEPAGGPDPVDGGVSAGLQSEDAPPHVDEGLPEGLDAVAQAGEADVEDLVDPDRPPDVPAAVADTAVMLDVAPEGSPATILEDDIEVVPEPPPDAAHAEVGAARIEPADDEQVEGPVEIAPVGSSAAPSSEQ